MDVIKLCKDCRWVWIHYKPYCNHPIIPHSVYDGSPYVSVHIARSSDYRTECGPEAKLFEANND